jgi:hypothetical protein|tara:strand:+ start:401 stop:577 length:177 start_codon:yes stop_codon:yes gene_type:complete
MNIESTCHSCKNTYTLEWYDYTYTMYDVENDEYEETEPIFCPFCGTPGQDAYEEGDEI